MSPEISMPLKRELKMLPIAAYLAFNNSFSKFSYAE